MAVSGNIYGNFGRKTPIVGIFGNFWEFYGNFMGVPSTWLHQHRNSPDSAGRALEPSHLSTYQTASRSSPRPYAAAQPHEADAHGLAAVSRRTAR